MGLGGCIILIAVGAILTFATDWDMQGVNLDLVGVIFMIVGLIGVATFSSIARRRRVVVPPGDPGGRRPGRPPAPGRLLQRLRGVEVLRELVRRVLPEPAAGEQAARGTGTPGGAHQAVGEPLRVCSGVTWDQILPKPWLRSFLASFSRWAAEEEARTVPTTVLPFRVAAKTRQYLASGPEPVFTPIVPE